MQGLAFMHSKNIMHRDIKPENIMLQKKGDLNSLKIVDFGLATYCDVEKYNGDLFYFKIPISEMRNTRICGT